MGVSTAPDAPSPADATLTSPEFDRSAVCCILVQAEGKVLSRGTGTLVYRPMTPAAPLPSVSPSGDAPHDALHDPLHDPLHGASRGLVLSALHVVANRRADPPEPYPGVITLQFPDFTTTGTIVAGAWDRVADWVLIECAARPPITPMPVARLGESGRLWQSYGFPDANPFGMLLSGSVAYCDGTLESVRAHQLTCEQAGAGAGGKVMGMSGAPVVIGERLVGVMRFALMDAGRAEMGTLYACPVAAVSEKWPMLDAPPLPAVPRQLSFIEALTESAGRELFAITAASILLALLVLLLAMVTVPHMNVEGTLQTSAVRFTLAKRGPLGLESGAGMLEVSQLGVTGLDSVEIGGRRFRAATVQLAVDADRTSRDALVLDFGVPLSAGTRVTLRRDIGRTVNKYQLVLDALHDPVTVAFRGRVRGVIGDGEETIDTITPDTTRAFVERTLTMHGAQALQLDFALPASTQRETDDSDGNLTVHNLDFYEVGRDGLLRTPAIRNGTLVLDGRETGTTVRLHQRDSLVIAADSLRVFGLSIPGENGMVAVTFGGTVHDLAIGGADGTHLPLMPTWLTRVRQRYPVQAFMLGLAFALFVASMAIRRQRRQAHHA